MAAIPEIVAEGKTGFQFDNGSALSLVSAVDKAEALDADAYRAMQSAALAFAKTNFSREAYYEALTAFFGRVMDAR